VVAGGGLGKSCSNKDVLIDSIGIAGFYIFMTLKKRRTKWS